VRDLLGWLLAFGALLPIPMLVVIFALREGNEHIRKKNEVLWSRWYVMPLLLAAIFWPIWFWAPR
jgi:hypothetical protein